MAWNNTRAITYPVPVEKPHIAGSNGSKERCFPIVHPLHLAALTAMASCGVQGSCYLQIHMLDISEKSDDQSRRLAYKYSGVNQGEDEKEKKDTKEHSGNGEGSECMVDWGINVA